MFDKAEIGWKEQNDKAETCRENLWNKIQLKGPSRQKQIPWADGNGMGKLCWFVLVSGCFKPSQPQRIISGLKTNFKLSPSYSVHNSSNHKFSKIYKISPNTNYIKQNIQTQNQTISPFRLTLFKKKKKKGKKARIHWYHGPFCQINTRFFYKYF